MSSAFVRKVTLAFAEGLEKVSGPSALYVRQRPFRAEGTHHKNRPSALRRGTFLSRQGRHLY